MGYRDEFFKHTRAYRGKYQCVRCKRWFSKSEIEVDHRIPKRHGGTDDLYNLQAMCRHCNRSKRERNTGFETAETLARATFSGDIGTAIGSIAKQKIKDALGFKYKRK